MSLYTTQNILFELRKYPAGEDHSTLNAEIEDRLLEDRAVIVEAHCRNLGDLARLKVQNDILRRNGITACWVVPYFPCARQDRRESQRSGFELKFALKLVAGLQIVVADPHSDVAGQLPHFTQASCVAEFTKALPSIKDAVVVIPDAGAAKKAYEWAAGDDRKIVQALKVRDPKTGKLSGFKVIASTETVDETGSSPGELFGKDIVIVDDICDAGGTFLGLGALLKNEHGVRSMTLAVTHGLFTKGTGLLASVFDNIVTFVPSDNPTPNPDVIEIPFANLYDNHYMEIL